MLRTLDITLLRKLIEYNSETGKAIWLPRTPDMFTPKGQLKPESLCRSFNSRVSGSPALDCLDKKSGYLCGNVFGRRFQAHRAFWAIQYGEWPAGDIDHINGNRTDNRICNLRDVTHMENLRNSSIGVRNKSGVLGVYWGKDRNMWRAEISVDGERIKLGSFETLEDAVDARKEAEKFYGFHKNHGKPRI